MQIKRPLIGNYSDRGLLPTLNLPLAPNIQSSLTHSLDSTSHKSTNKLTNPNLSNPSFPSVVSAKNTFQSSQRNVPPKVNFSSFPSSIKPGNLSDQYRDHGRESSTNSQPIQNTLTGPTKTLPFANLDLSLRLPSLKRPSQEISLNNPIQKPHVANIDARSECLDRSTSSETSRLSGLHSNTELGGPLRARDSPCRPVPAAASSPAAVNKASPNAGLPRLMDVAIDPAALNHSFDKDPIIGLSPFSPLKQWTSPGKGGKSETSGSSDRPDGKNDNKPRGGNIKLSIGSPPGINRMEEHRSVDRRTDWGRERRGFTANVDRSASSARIPDRVVRYSKSPRKGKML